MEWAQLAPDFEWDGSWRDIYVQGTSVADWQLLLDKLASWEPRPGLMLDGEPVSLPTPAQALLDRGGFGAMLSVQVAGVRLNCHFFAEDEIEFDLDPREVTDETEAEALGEFMTWLAELTGKAVILTHENVKEAVILKSWPGSGQAVWVPPPLA